MEQRVIVKIRKDFQVDSEDWNDVTFTGQRVRWTKDPQSGSCIEVNQHKALDELEEMSVERNTKRKNFSTVPLQCIQGTEAFLDR